MEENEQRIIEFDSGQTLEIQPVGQTALIQYFDGMGGIENFLGDKPISEVIAELPDIKRVIALKNINGMINYAAGWGVVDNPPPQALKALSTIAQYTGIEELDRAAWVRFIVLGGKDELAMELLTAVIEVSRG